MRRCAIYCRISADREGRELGVERQEEDCRALAARLGYEVVAVFRDNDLSASTKSKKKRPGYTTMLKDAKAGLFDVILAYTTGRLTRRPREHEDLIDLAVDHGVEFQYVRSPSFDLNTAQGRRVARTLAAQDAGEAEEIAERIQRQKQQAAIAGEWRGGRRPYGYGLIVGYDKRTNEPIRDHNQLVPEEAEEIAQATKEILLGGSMRALAADMNQRGLVTSTGRPWEANELRKVLRRARNAGLVEVKREDGSMEVVARAKWPAIVSEEEWRAVVLLLDDPSRRTNKTNIARRWLGSGLYLCAVCGETVRATSGGGRGGGASSYKCHKKKERDKAHVTRRCDYVDDVVVKEVLGWLGMPETAAHLVRHETVDTAALRAQAVEIRGQIAEASDMYVAREIGRQQLATITDRKSVV